MKTLIFAINSFWGMIWYGVKAFPIFTWTGFATLFLGGFLLNEAFIIKLEAFLSHSKAKHQLFVLMLLFGLFCLYFGFYQLWEAKKRRY